MTWSMYGSFLAVMLLVVIVPGPDTAVVLKNSLAGGLRGGLLAIIGVMCGSLMVGSAVAFGLGVLITRSQPVFQALKWAGVLYLLYLGLQALRGAWRGNHAEASTGGPVHHGFRSWREGFLSSATNPKILVLYLSVLPQFLVPGSSQTLDALLMVGTTATLGGLWLLTLAAGAHRMRGWLSRRRVRRCMDGVTGTALLGFGTALALES